MTLKHTQDLPLLGFIGLGAMGGRMARNLLKAGYPLYSFDLDKDHLEACVREGACRAESVKEVVDTSDIVLTSLPTSEVFVHVAEEVLLPSARQGQIFIELGTTVPADIRRLSAQFSERGALLLDAPVTGWITGAEEGTLRIWIGGDEKAYARCLPILRVIGDPEKLHYFGESGNGQVAKGINQLLSGLQAAAFMEVAAFGVRSGLSPDFLGESFGYKSGFPKTVERIAGGSGEEIGVNFQELRYYLREAEEGGFALPLTEALHAFCKDGDKLSLQKGQPTPSFWRELIKWKP
ncbi:NAD(P)-dependent oxidoreductase [Paenibacillus roseipurpureus]|uniref:NAD(P)-dependent oxidoreductase n=1 Tax=Paenibacillus roseopurpureus TaxID=2918901 RepID=A0AA96LQB6_9BACL|nr:NAD(P)-dependent oxidoreductase [Paenibacillus sp. MBLB1832]WNR45293.1 NAD(P)-dependent oxidoreductase [Paenibacillus sp. MBLB1832]